MDEQSVISQWLRYESFAEWREHVRAPGQVVRAIGLTMDRLRLPFRDALIYTMGQGAVIPASPTAAIADLARFEQLLERLPAAPDADSHA